MICVEKVGEKYSAKNREELIHFVMKNTEDPRSRIGSMIEKVGSVYMWTESEDVYK